MAKPATGALRGAIFDLDGTLVDSGLDFDAIRREMGLEDGQPLLETLDGMATGEALRCRAILDRHEWSGALRAVPLPGVMPFLDGLDAMGLRRALLTRNSRRATEFALQRCGLEFEQVLTRDDGPVKPDPWAIHRICEHWRIDPQETVLFGDFRFDIEAGHAAGALTVMVCNGHAPTSIPGHELADFCIPSFAQSSELSGILRRLAAPGN
jgi:phosphoglycolate phosphatase